ncbi:MAG: hypothetical protein KGY75_03200 [Candidatus Cloacimonetes bacterium]|nr:hypothetical protein [Candidatus Cloacimonadota bacterium]
MLGKLISKSDIVFDLILWTQKEIVLGVFVINYDLHLYEEIMLFAFNDALLDECLERLATAKKIRTMRKWVEIFSGIKQMKKRSALQLCRRGILQMKKFQL